MAWRGGVVWRGRGSGRECVRGGCNGRGRGVGVGVGVGRRGARVWREWCGCWVAREHCWVHCPLCSLAPKRVSGVERMVGGGACEDNPPSRPEKAVGCARAWAGAVGAVGAGGAVWRGAGIACDGVCRAPATTPLPRSPTRPPPKRTRSLTNSAPLPPCPHTHTPDHPICGSLHYKSAHLRRHDSFELREGLLRTHHHAGGIGQAAEPVAVEAIDLGEGGTVLV